MLFLSILFDFIGSTFSIFEFLVGIVNNDVPIGIVGTIEGELCEVDRV